MRTLADLLVYLLLRSFVTVVGWLPLSWAYSICGRIGRLAVGLTPGHLAVGLKNLDQAFPGSSRECKLETYRSSYERLGHLLVEVARLPGLTRSVAARRVVYEPGQGLENYQQARVMGEGKGVLFVTAHVSAWELLPAAHALLGNPLAFIVRPLDNPFLERWAKRVRSQFGNQTLPKSGALRGVLRALQQGRDVGFLLDQNVQEKEAVYVPFFGHLAATSPAVANLAVRTRAPIIAGFIYPLDRIGNYRIRFYPPLQVGPDADPVEVTAEITRLIEEVIRDYPDCWLWGHRRFHTQPDGSDFYGNPGEGGRSE